MNGANFTGIPSYGDLMSLEDFKESVRNGGFIDYDGSGNLATDSKCSDITIIPSEVEDYDFPEWCSHIVWYNR